MRRPTRLGGMPAHRRMCQAPKRTHSSPARPVRMTTLSAGHTIEVRAPLVPSDALSRFEAACLHDPHLPSLRGRVRGLARKARTVTDPPIPTNAARHDPNAHQPLDAESSAWLT